MELASLIGWIEAALPSTAAAVMTGLALWIAAKLMRRRARVAEGYRLRMQVVLAALGGLGLLAIILTLPVSGEVRGQLVSFVGIVLSAAVALSATTLLGNALAGVMLRAIGGFHMGDFIRVNDHFGRISERGLFHTEIQTEERELTTLPNLYLVSNPVTTIRKSGTVVEAEVSIGYDEPRSRVETLLLEAARDCELDEPFVQIRELGDFSVTYRIAGLLGEVKDLISRRSRLRGAAIDALHRGGVEIVSPTFMNQRVYSEDRRFVPEPEGAERTDEGARPEETVFDKAEEAEEIEELERRYAELGDQIKELSDRRAEATGDDKERLDREIEQAKANREELADTVERRKEKVENEG